MKDIRQELSELQRTHRQGTYLVLWCAICTLVGTSIGFAIVEWMR